MAAAGGTCDQVLAALQGVQVRDKRRAHTRPAVLRLFQTVTLFEG